MNTTTPAITRSSLFRSRATLLLIVALFLLPAFFAFIYLKTESWKSSELTHHGELILPPYHTSQLKVSPLPTTLNIKENNQAKSIQALPVELWQILYIAPNNCDNACINSQYISQQVRTGLGPERHRVSTHFIHLNVDEPISDTLVLNDQTVELSSTGPFSRWQMRYQTPLSAQAETDAEKALDPSHSVVPGYIYLADPQGNIMMKYMISKDFNTALQQAKGLKKDLKKLLKLSRIG